MNHVPFIPESAPFTIEQRAWLNGFLAGLFSQGPVPQLSPRQPNGESSPAGEPLLILFGSQTGTAEGLAKRFADEARRRGFIPKILPLNDCGPGLLVQTPKAVIISSTWGDGDPPDNAAAFWSWLASETAPVLPQLQFAVLGLGDRNYAEFCGASKKFDARLEALGARRLAPRGECDADYESAAKTWLDGLWEKLGPAAPQAGTRNGPPANGAVNGVHKLNGSAGASAPIHDRQNPYLARLLKKVRLNKSGSAKDVRHYEFAIPENTLRYEVGDALGIMPANCPDLVNEFLAIANCKGDESVNVEGKAVSLREALTEKFDITKPSRELLAVVGARVPESGLGSLLAPERAEVLKNWLWSRDVIDVLQLLPAPPPITELLPLLRKLAPRLYSIASCPKSHPGEVHITVSTVRYKSSGRARKGVASTFLADQLEIGDGTKVFVAASSGFKPPPGGDTPMIMVGPGTGIAPFRAFLEHRRAHGAQGRNWLFFGDQTRAGDFLYEDQLLVWHKDGLLTRLDLAFSRDQAEKIYVQHRMQENSAEIWSWLEAGAHFLVCGDASRMARDVDAALHAIIQKAGGRSEDDAKAYVAKLKTDRRYQRDVY